VSGCVVGVVVVAAAGAVVLRAGFAEVVDGDAFVPDEEHAHATSAIDAAATRSLLRSPR